MDSAQTERVLRAFGEGYKIMGLMDSFRTDGEILENISFHLIMQSIWE